MTDNDQAFPDTQKPLDETDVVFARFKGHKPAAAGRHETLTIPARAGAAGSRVVQVVHLRSGTKVGDRPRRSGAKAMAAAWDAIFDSKATLPVPLPNVPPAALHEQPVNPMAPMQRVIRFSSRDRP